MPKRKERQKREDRSGETGRIGNGKLSLPITLANAAAAAAAASWLTNPLDMSKLRLQVNACTRARNKTYTRTSEHAA